MIDFHTHLDLYENSIEIAKKTSVKNNFTLAVTTSPKAWVATKRVLGSLPNIEIALGLHPEIVDRKKSELDMLLQLVAESNYIGEVGLDGSPKYKSSFPLQVAILDSIFRECALQGGRIISIHSRRAVSEILDLLDKHPDAGTAVLHWFSGSKSELSRAIDRGCWFSFGPAGVANAFGKSVLGSIPLDRLLPESDGPFAQINGSAVMPWEANGIISEISSSRGISKAIVEDQFQKNLGELLKLRALKKSPGDVGAPHR